MIDAPVFFADIFARNVRARAETCGHRFAAIYSTGTSTTWDFPRTATEALAPMACAARDGQQVVVFSRGGDEVWRLRCHANLPHRRGNAA